MKFSPRIAFWFPEQGDCQNKANIAAGCGLAGCNDSARFDIACDYTYPNCVQTTVHSPSEHAEAHVGRASSLEGCIPSSVEGSDPLGAPSPPFAAPSSASDSTANSVCVLALPVMKLNPDAVEFMPSSSTCGRKVTHLRSVFAKAQVGRALSLEGCIPSSVEGPNPSGALPPPFAAPNPNLVPAPCATAASPSGTWSLSATTSAPGKVATTSGESACNLLALAPFVPTSHGRHRNRNDKSRSDNRVGATFRRLCHALEPTESPILSPGVYPAPVLHTASHAKEPTRRFTVFDVWPKPQRDTGILHGECTSAYLKQCVQLPYLPQLAEY